MSRAAFDRRSSLSGPVQLRSRGQALASCQVAHGCHMLTWVPVQSGQDAVPGLHCAKVGVLPWLWQPLGCTLLQSMADSNVGW